jgi:hypothetical protein
MNNFDRIRALDKLLEKAFEELNNINPEETDKNVALTNLIKGFKKTHDNIHFDLLNSYYESQNPNIEEKIIERLEGLVKLMRIFIEFEK